MHVKTKMMETLSAVGKKYKYPALILILGIFLLLFPTGTKEETAAAAVSEPASGETGSGAFDLEAFTASVEALLSGVSGAGEVKLLLTLDTDGINTYLADESTSHGSDDSQAESQTVLAKASGDEVPITVTRTFPAFRGAVVLCQGAQDPKVTLGIKEAISSLTGLGMDKITVLKMD